MIGRPFRMTLLAAVCLAGVVVFLLPVVARPTAVPFWREADYTDLVVAHLPSALFLHRAVATWAQIPLWNPTILSGIPFAADPLSGLWYPPLWLAAAAPFPVTFNLLSFLHLFWAGLGMGLFLRKEGLGWGPAMLGALAFAGTPKLVGHVALGHVTLVYAVSWLPWLLLATCRLVESFAAGSKHSFRWAAALGGLVGLVFLTDPRWVIPSGMVVLAYAVAAWTRQPALGGKWGAAAGGAAVAGAFALGMSAVLAIPLSEWVGLSTRTGLGSQPATYPLPAGRLIGLVVPQMGGWPEWMTSVGVAVLILAALGVASRARGSRLWAGVVVAGWILALGDATPIGVWLGRLPGMDLLRVPPRWLLASSFGLAVLSAWGAEAILREEMEPAAARRMRLIGLGVVTAFVAMGLGIVTVGRGEVSFGPALFVGPIIALSAYVLLVLRPRLTMGWAAALWIALLVADLGVLDSSLITMRAEEETTSPEVEALARAWAVEGRIFSPSYAIPQTTAARLGLELADGVHPLQLRAYVNWMATATGFDVAGYSVTLPPFPSGDPKLDWGVTADAESLGRLAVTRVVSDYPIQSDGWQPPQIADGLLVYPNPSARAFAWLESPGSDEWNPVEILLRSPNRIWLRARGPGRLTLSEVAYPGWTVAVDGDPASMLVVDGLLRGVEVGGGEHLVAFEFRPTSVYVGLTLTLATVVGLILLWRPWT